MPATKITVLVEQDGVVIDTLVRRVQTTDVSRFDYSEASDNDATTYSTLPVATLASIGALIVQTDTAATIRLDGQSNKGIRLAAGGLLVIVDATIDVGVATNALVNVPGTTAAQVRGLAAGT